MTDYPISHVPNNPTLKGFAHMVKDITFTDREEDSLQLQLLLPWKLSDNEGNDLVYPAVVFVQGSSWTFPNVYHQLPQLAQLARQGYVAATVTHRSFLDGHQSPAFLKDVKTSIRFLRANAKKYHIDPEHIGIWGTSSGGNAALLVGLTADTPEYKTAEWQEQSDAVNFVVDCFGPTNTVLMVEQIQKAIAKFQTEIKNLSPGQQLQMQTEKLEQASTLELGMQQFFGSPDGSLDMEKIQEISPVHRLDADKAYPPFLILHGDQDRTVKYEQSVLMYKALLDHGTVAEMISVDGADHENDFWSQEILDAIGEFIAKHI